MTKGAFFHHFASKNDLGVAATRLHLVEHETYSNGIQMHVSDVN